MSKNLCAAIKYSRSRVVVNLYLSLQIEWLYDIEDFEPGRVNGKNANTSPGSVERGFGVLIAVGVDSNVDTMVLEELRAAGTLLLQTKDEVLRVEEWSIWTGIGVAEWIDIRASWVGGVNLKICELEANLNICRNHSAELKDRLFAHIWSRAHYI